MQEGDSRTHAAATPAPAAPAAAGAPPAAAALLSEGKRVFTTTCQACHQAGGQGIPGAFPPLDGSEWVTGPPKRIAAIILHGIDGPITVKGQAFHGVMPTFKDQLKPEEIAAVATYVRQTFGKKADTIPPELVKQTAEETKSRGGPWTGGDELEARKWE
jgi:mono/diheme cytochrome c family protein